MQGSAGVRERSLPIPWLGYLQVTLLAPSCSGLPSSKRPPLRLREVKFLTGSHPAEVACRLISKMSEWECWMKPSQRALSCTPLPGSGSPKAWRHKGYGAGSRIPECILPPPPGLMTNHVCNKGRRTHCQMCDKTPACRKLLSGDYHWLDYSEQPPFQRSCVYQMLRVSSQSALEDFVLPRESSSPRRADSRGL